MRNGGKTSLIAAVVGCALLLACGCAKSPQRKAELEKKAQARAKIAELETTVAKAQDDASRAKALRGILDIEVMDIGELKPALDLYAKNEALLSGDCASRVYVAVAQSMVAGREKKIENKLKWLRVGMNSFEALREEFPDDRLVYLYQASTYANFPREVGAKDEVLSILDDIRGRYERKAWAVEEGDVGNIDYIYATLERTYSDTSSKDELGASRKRFAALGPEFAALEKGPARK